MTIHDDDQINGDRHIPKIAVKNTKKSLFKCLQNSVNDQGLERFVWCNMLGKKLRYRYNSAER